MTDDNNKNPEEQNDTLNEQDVFETPNNLSMDMGEPLPENDGFEDLNDLQDIQELAPDSGDFAQDYIENDTLADDGSYEEITDTAAFTDELGEDFDADMGDMDFNDDAAAFADEWNDDSGESDFDFSEEDSEGNPAIAASPLASLLENKAVKFGGMGIGGLVAVAAIYFFVLDGGAGTSTQAPQPQQQASTAPQQANNNPAIAALNAPQVNDGDNSLSIFADLDNIPEPNKVDGVSAADRDDDGQDIFSLMNNRPEPQATKNNAASNSTVNAAVTGEPQDMPVPQPTTVAQTQTPTATNFGSDTEFEALPMPTPISSETIMESPKPGHALDTPSTADNQSFDIIADMGDSSGDPFAELGITDGVDALDPVDTTTVQDGVIAIDTPASSVPQPNKQPHATAQVASVDMGGISEQLSRLNNRLDDMNNRIEKLERGNKNSSNNSDMARIEKMIKRLENRIEDLASNKQVMASNNAVRSSSRSSEKTSHARVKKASIDTKAAPAPKKSTSSAKAKTSNISRWSLRGAGPNQAFIAKKGSSDIKTVHVGEKVSGLGTIKFIGLEKGKWVVKTSNGTIRQ